MDPLTTFIVPCYKLAHLLGECVNSILNQTCGDFEILIMDDCSPDNTPEVAQSFRDPRVKYIRNNPNLGHLRNYNKGIELAKGKYIWLISADDCLRRNYVLERYVRLLEQHPNVGYVFCPAMDLDHGRETKVLEYSFHGDQDRIFPGHQFAAKLIQANSITAPSVMARAGHFRRNPFPLDMPWGGDWYLWLVFALESDVGYFAEPMVCYRRHEGSMTSLLMQQDLRACASDDIRIPWMIKKKIEGGADSVLTRSCLAAIAGEYARRIASRRYRTSTSYMSLSEFEESLAEHSSNPREKTWIRAYTYQSMADRYCWEEEYASARQFYFSAIRQKPFMPKAWIRFLVLSTGSLGIRLRKGLLMFRQMISVPKSGL